MHRNQCKNTSNIENQGNITPPKEQNNSPVMKFNYKEIYKIAKIIQTNNLKETQWDTRENR